LKAKLLIENGASCFASDLNPLHIAIKAKNYKVMRVLYRQGDASPNRNIADEKSPLEMAIIQNDSNLVRELLHWKEL
jgi:ankyrin repeat protein